MFGLGKNTLQVNEVAIDIAAPDTLQKKRR